MAVGPETRLACYLGLKSTRASDFASLGLAAQHNVGSYGLVGIDAILLTGIAHNRHDPPIVVGLERRPRALDLRAAARAASGGPQ
jgi:hypothetical protein